jgi:hypothetical protein
VKDPIQLLIEAGIAATSLFPANSRYHGLAVAKLTRPDGQDVVFLRRRFLPSPERFSTVRDYAVRQEDRLDLIAARDFGDPELFWRLCDANGALRPEELLEELGRRLRITLPEGVPGGEP